LAVTDSVSERLKGEVRGVERVHAGIIELLHLANEFTGKQGRVGLGVTRQDAAELTCPYALQSHFGLRLHARKLVSVLENIWRRTHLNRNATT
jgi:hypothetical protein